MVKGKPILEDLRWAIVRMNTLGMRIDTISLYTDFSNRQIYRIINRFLTTGKVLTATQRRKTRQARHLTTADVAFLHGTLDKSCDRYLEELQLGLAETCGRVVSLSTVWRALKRSGYTMVNVLLGSQSSEVMPSAQASATRWAYTIDQTNSFLSMKAHAIDVPLIMGNQGTAPITKFSMLSYSSCRYSVLPAILLDGILYVSILEGSFTTETFTDFIDALLDKMNPFPGPNSVIVMDNCRIHKAEGIREMIEAW
ncbi:hypothetical protein B0H19DRAFT_1324180 [Mycena capillaripes]|nr:hypothetical protein B0H19DRAFT_1324180 [Mycena capillaripes]